MIKIVILQDNQTISRIDKNKIVSDSTGIVHLQVVDMNAINTADHYDSYQAVFWHEDGSIEYVNIDPINGICEIPDTCLKEQTFKIGLYGVLSNGSLLTTNRIVVDVISSGFEEPESYPDAYSKLLCRVEKLEKKVGTLSSGTSSIGAFEVKLNDVEEQLKMVSSSVSAFDVRIHALEDEVFTTSSVSSGRIKLRSEVR